MGSPKDWAGDKALRLWQRPESIRNLASCFGLQPGTDVSLITRWQGTKQAILKGEHLLPWHVLQLHATDWEKQDRVNCVRSVQNVLQKEFGDQTVTAVVMVS